MKYPPLTPQELADATGNNGDGSHHIRGRIEREAEADTRRALKFGQFLDSLFTGERR